MTLAPGIGFADPVRDAAHAFRGLLDAMARPGSVRRLPCPPPPPPLSPAAAAVALTLSDADAPIWLAPGVRSRETAAFLRFHTSAAPADDAGAAAFVLGRWAALRGLDGLSEGTPEYPDRSTTLIVEVDGLAEGRGATLEGPGVPGARRLHVEGVDDAFWALSARNRLSYPLGLDVILTCGETVAALPRTVRADV